MSTIAFSPRIDLAPAREPAERRALADVIGAACAESGFFVISGHGVPGDLVARMDAVTREFFRLPPHEKQQAALAPDNPMRHGWDGGGKLRTGVGRGVDSPPDLVEMFKITRPDGPTAHLNRWPRSPSAFEATWLEYYAALELLTDDLIRLLALALELPERWFDDKVRNHNTMLAANYYPPQPTAPLDGQLRRGPHSDYGMLTVLYRDSAAGGLEVQDRDGGWHNVPTIPGTFVVNIGDLMAELSGGRFVSSVHRAVNPPRELADTDRISIPFFRGPNPDLPVVPIGSTPSGGEPVITAREWVQRRISATYSP